MTTVTIEDLVSQVDELNQSTRALLDALTIRASDIQKVLGDDLSPAILACGNASDEITAIYQQIDAIKEVSDHLADVASAISAAQTATDEAAAASTSAQAAATEAAAAATSAQTATDKAADAATAAQTAASKASAAATSESNAATSAQTATDEAAAAATSAQTATDKAADAATSAQTASSKASEAAQSALDASSASRLTIGTVSSVSAATPATATITGQAGTQLLNLELPRGNDGAGAAQNLLINSEFVIDQLNGDATFGTKTLAAGKYGHDGWKAGANGCVYSIAQTIDSGFVVGGVTITITSGSLIQTVEANRLPTGNNTLALSWQGTAQGKIGSGTYGSSGVTATVSGNSNLSVEFGTGTLTRAKLEQGTVPTTYFSRGYDTDLFLCKRYLQSVSAFAGYGYNTSGIIQTTIQLPVSMAFAPSVSGSGLLVALCNGTSYQQTSFGCQIVQAAADSMNVFLKNFGSTVSGGFYTAYPQSGQKLWFEARL